MIAKLRIAPEEQYFRLSLVPWKAYVAFCDTRRMKRKHPGWYRDDLARLFAAAGRRQAEAGDR